MDGIIINELSLNGQFLDSRDFWKNGMPPFHKALQDALSHGVGYLFKQGSFCCASHARQDFTRFADSAGNPYHR